jgi:hypothetical protein
LSLAASYLSVGIGVAGEGGSVKAWGTTRPSGRVKGKKGG